MQIKPGCIVVVVIGRFSIAKLCARDRDRGTLGSSEDLDRGADGTCDAPLRSGSCSTSAPENLQLSRRTQNGYLVVRIIFPASQGQGHPQHGAGCLTAPRSAIDRSDPDKETYVFFENVRQRRAGDQTNAMGSSHRVLTIEYPIQHPLFRATTRGVII